MICENCGIRPASVQVFQQQGGQRVTSYLCMQCARQLGMIGGGGNFGGASPFEMLQNLIQQQGGQGPNNFFEALSGEAREAVMRAREASAGTTRTNAIGTDHLLAGIVTGDNVATEALGRAGANVDEMRSTFAEQRGDPGEAVYTFTPSAKHALQLAFQAARQMGAAQIGSEHLLLGLLGEGDGNAYQIPARNGAGDAEALRRINRLIEPTAAEVYLVGEATSGMDPLELRRRVGMVFQVPALFGETVEEAVVYGARLAGKEAQAARLLEMAGLDASFAGKDPGTLSVGEQQRVSIARALALEPEALLMDEPTSALDEAARRRIEELVRGLNATLGLTIVVVSHDLDQVSRVADRVVVLVGGRSEGEWSREEFFSDRKSVV